MNKIDCLKIKEKIYTDKLENGLRVIIVPKKELSKKYIIWGTNFGSIDRRSFCSRWCSSLFRA